MRALRYLHLALILVLSYAVVFSATGRVGKAPYKACLSTLSHQVKLVGVPEPARQVAPAVQTTKPATDQDALLLLGFRGFGLRDAVATPVFVPVIAMLASDDAPRGAPLALRI